MRSDLAWPRLARKRIARKRIARKLAIGLFHRLLYIVNVD